MTTLELSPRRIVRALAACVGVLTVLSYSIRYYEIRYGDRAGELNRLFWVDAEANIPTFFSALVLVFGAVLVGRMALAERRSGGAFARHWTGLALIMLFLAVDESTALHEMLIEPVRDALGTSGYLRFAWVIPGSIAVAVFVLAYVRFLRSIPRETAVRMVVAGAVFVAGALGLEMVGGQFKTVYGEISRKYITVASAEELCEMLGALLFVRAMLRHLERLAPRTEIRIGSGAGGAGSAGSAEPGGRGERRDHSIRTGRVSGSAPGVDLVASSNA